MLNEIKSQDRQWYVLICQTRLRISEEDRAVFKMSLIIWHSSCQEGGSGPPLRSRLALGVRPSSVKHSGAWWRVKSQARPEPWGTCMASWTAWSPHALSWDTAATQECTFSSSGRQCQLSPACQLPPPKQEMILSFPLPSWISELNACLCRQEGTVCFVTMLAFVLTEF